MERSLTKKDICFGKPILTRESGKYEILPNTKVSRVFDMLKDLNALLDKEDEISEISQITLWEIWLVAHVYLRSLKWNFNELENYLKEFYGSE